MATKRSEKGINSRDPKTWGIKEHWNIPEELITRMANMKGFNIHIVLAASREQLEFYEAVVNYGDGWTMSESALDVLRVHFWNKTIPRMIDRLTKEPYVSHFSLCDVLAHGELIEYCLVADGLKKLLEELAD